MRLSSLALLLAFAATAVGVADGDGASFIREPGRCAMRSECGSKGSLGGQIPCPDNGLAVKVSSQKKGAQPLWGIAHLVWLDRIRIHCTLRHLPVSAAPTSRILLAALSLSSLL
jgi:hypothetical protein